MRESQADEHGGHGNKPREIRSRGLPAVGHARHAGQVTTPCGHVRAGPVAAGSLALGRRTRTADTPTRTADTPG